MRYSKKIKKLVNINAYKLLLIHRGDFTGEICKATLLNVSKSLSNVLLAIITKSMVDFAVGKDLSNAAKYGAIFLIILLFELFLSSYTSYYTANINVKFKNNLQAKMISKLYRKDWIAYSKFNTGDLLTRIYSDTDNIVNSLMVSLPNLVALMLQLLVAFFILFFYDGLLAMLTFFVTPITIIFGLIIGNKMKELQHKAQIFDSQQRSLVNESLQNIIILKTFNFLEHSLNKINTIQTDRYKIIQEKNSISLKANFMLGIGYRFGFFGALAFGAFRLINEVISFGTFTAFLQLVGHIQGPIHGLSQTIPQIIATLSSVERINELEELVDEETIESEETVLHGIPDKISIINLGFSYIETKPVLKNINLEINRGEKIAILGASGEGKTTLIHLLLSLLKPQLGEVVFSFNNGSRVRMSVSTRQYFSYVPQVNSLFSGTIRDNFLLTEHIDESDIIKALEASCAIEFIDELPMGIETILSERGIGLSQGQAQRITIARALIHKAPILVFDEATSALDMETEHQLIENLKFYYPHVTLIIITHRKSILEICNKVYEIKNGELNHVRL